MARSVQLLNESPKPAPPIQRQSNPAHTLRRLWRVIAAEMGIGIGRNYIYPPEFSYTLASQNMAVTKQPRWLKDVERSVVLGLPILRKLSRKQTAYLERFHYPLLLKARKQERVMPAAPIGNTYSVPSNKLFDDSDIESINRIIGSDNAAPTYAKTSRLYVGIVLFVFALIMLIAWGFISL